MDFQEKMKTDRSIDKYKVRLIAKDCRQNEGFDYFDKYSLVTKITSICMFIAIVALHNFELYQIDVKTAFLNGDLNEKIYMDKGLFLQDKRRKYVSLLNHFYGLKQNTKIMT